MKLRVTAADVHILEMRTRMPFRYGIATMTRSPHAFVRVELEIDGRRATGVASDHLAPKWFTKNPDSPVADDVAEMIKVVTTACDVIKSVGAVESVFDLWKRAYQGQLAWGGGWGLPPLLSGFGTSFVERAVLDAFCRDQNVTFANAVRENRLGIRLGDLHAELRGAQPADLLPAKPLRTINARHTVGLGDPLTDKDIPPGERVTDGLPQSLEAAVAAYGIKYFKIKLAGDVERDVDRVKRVADVVWRSVGNDYGHTLDGNENFKAVEPFRRFWEQVSSDASLSPFLSKLIFVEQPFHRDVALDPTAMAEFKRWENRPPTIIDESDGELKAAPLALDLGYVGTSHKNCKGVIKGIANACLMEHRERADPAGRHVLSGEDLSNVGPTALLEDLAVMATLGVSHVERNGHHYFRGLTNLPDDLAETVLRAHPDLYRRHAEGFPTVRIDNGRVEVGSVVDAPFGMSFTFDPGRFTPVEKYKYE